MLGWSTQQRHGAKPWAALALVPALVLTGCAPSLNWRDVAVDGAGLTGQFPCKPALHQREALVDAAPLKMSLRSCEAADATFAVLWFDVASPAAVEPMLESLRAQALGSAAPKPGALHPMDVAGATPQRRSGRWVVERITADGARRWQTIAVFARGQRVVQASVTAATPPKVQDGAEAFFASLRWEGS